MIIYPAIDLFEGKVVRLTRGDYAQTKVYSERPEEVAREWESQGASWIHVVDLEGARDGHLKNGDALRKIRKAVKIKIQFGGGLRNIEDVQFVLGEGINRAVIGTKALDENLLATLLSTQKERIAVSLDVREGVVQTQGWLKDEGKQLEAAIKTLNSQPLKTLIYTDIKNDGMLAGPNFQELEVVLASAKASVILSGGVACLEDIRRCASLHKTNFDGVIVGKALYEKKFTLREAIALTKG